LAGCRIYTNTQADGYISPQNGWTELRENLVLLMAKITHHIGRWMKYEYGALVEW
jgi:hypothetical protein